MLGVTAALGVGSGGGVAAAVDGAMLGTAAEALAAELAGGADEPQALTNSAPARTEAPASQH